MIPLSANHMHGGSRIARDLVGFQHNIHSSFVSTPTMALGNVSVGTTGTYQWLGMALMKAKMRESVDEHCKSVIGFEPQ